MNDIDKETFIGNQLVEFLGLQNNENNRYDTMWGDKTPQGLYLSIKKFITEKERIWESKYAKI